jgi:CelD/BcsL family acetyltransferase involved in cellulose biosynthesis
VAALSSECATLLADVLEPNVFYEPWMLAAAMANLPSEDVRVVVIRERTAGVTGIFPFELARRFRGLPMRSLKSWRHIYCFLCTPLLSAEHARPTLQRLLEWLASSEAPARMIELELYSAGGPFEALLTAELEGERSWRTLSQTYERAAFKPSAAWETGVSGKHLKELRRLGRRLAESGQCVYRTFVPGENIDPWLEQFLRLEASGWKGREQTALASDGASRGFFSSVARAAVARGALQMLAIEIDGVPIAMKCNFLAGDGSFAFKIAYDEAYSKFSPGVLLELFNMRNLVEQCPQIRWMDSCAIPQHFMINRLWTDRRMLAGRLMARASVQALMITHWQYFRRMRKLVPGGAP